MEIVKSKILNDEKVFISNAGKIIKQGRRPIKQGVRFNKLVNTSDVRFTSSLTYGNVDDTVKIMTDIIKKYHYQVKDLAMYLKCDTKLKTCKNVWEFVFNHIQYKRDKVGVEQLSTPARIWLNRSTEGTPSDCDDHSIFVGSLLYCLGIPFKIRIAGYDGNNFSHVYIIAEGDICIDTVLYAFNTEASYSSKKDSKMMQIETLQGFSGLGELSTLGELGNLGALSALASSALKYENTAKQLLPSESYLDNFQEDESINGFDDVMQSQIEAAKLLGREQLQITYADYLKEPELYHAKGFSPQYWELMKKALDSFKTENLDGIVVNLTNGADWEKKNLSPLNGVEDEDGQVTGLMGFLEGWFKKVRKWGKKTVKKGFKWAKKAVKNATKWVGGFLKKVGRFLMKINPIMIAVRAILRAKINANKDDLALTLGLGLLNSQQATAIGASTDEHAKAKRAFAKFLKKYRFLGGKTSKLKSVIAKAYRKHAKEANLPNVSLQGYEDLSALEGRRRRRRKRRRKARRAKEKAANLVKERKKFNSEKTKLLNKKMSKFKREQLDFLKVAFKSEAKRHGLAEPVTAGSSAAAIPISQKIIQWFLKMLGKLGLKKVITKLKEKRIKNLAKKAEEAAKNGATDLANKYLAKKEKAENNLVVFNQDSPRPSSGDPRKTNDITADSSSSSSSPIVVPDSSNPIFESKNKQAGMNKWLIGGLILIGGGMLYGSKDNKKKKEPKSKK